MKFSPDVADPGRGGSIDAAAAGVSTFRESSRRLLLLKLPRGRERRRTRYCSQTVA
ncbi:MAG TPA: hypothetical protein VK388_10955 [Pyrinomonadaceae bacterium]|nr:hypothetical protein [Pyrinomonadaceae bacterium]